MKIAIILPAAPAYSETFFNNLIKGLTDAGMQLVVFSRGRKPKGNLPYEYETLYAFDRTRPLKQVLQFIFAFFDFLTCPIRSTRLFKLERQSGASVSAAIRTTYLYVKILKHNFDWIYFGFATTAIGAELVAKSINASMAVSVRGYDVCIYPLKHKGCYKRLWANVDKVHAISDDLIQVAQNLGLARQSLIVKINPAINISDFSFKNDAAKLHDPVRILSVGRLHWKKGFETAIDAFKILKDKGLDFSYDIIGDGNEKERLTFAIHQAGLESRIKLLGKIPHKEVAAGMNGYDIYIQPSIQEGFCNAVLEAQAKGLCCIVSNAEGLPENVFEGKTGDIFEKRNPEALAQCIEQVLKTSETERLGRLTIARKRVEQDFNLEKQIKSFVDFFNNKDQ